jgi:hypothetical protein
VLDCFFLICFVFLLFCFSIAVEKNGLVGWLIHFLGGRVMAEASPLDLVGKEVMS